MEKRIEELHRNLEADGPKVVKNKLAEGLYSEWKIPFIEAWLAKPPDKKAAPKKALASE